MAVRTAAGRVEGGEVIDVAAFQGHVRRARVPGVFDQFVLVEQSKVVEGLADFNTDSRLYVHGEVETGETAAAAQVYQYVLVVEAVVAPDHGNDHVQARWSDRSVRPSSRIQVLVKGVVGHGG